MNHTNQIDVSNDTLELLNKFKEKFSNITLEDMSYDDIIKLLLNSFIESLKE
jgi:hypothetical protein